MLGLQATGLFVANGNRLLGARISDFDSQLGYAPIMHTAAVPTSVRIETGLATSGWTTRASCTSVVAAPSVDTATFSVTANTAAPMSQASAHGAAVSMAMTVQSATVTREETSDALVPVGTVSSTWSIHVDAFELRRIILRAARACGRRGQLLERGGQGPDHPVHPAMPETEYLKTFLVRLIRD